MLMVGLRFAYPTLRAALKISGHREFEGLVFGALFGDLVTRIRMPHDAGAGVVPEHAGDAFVGFCGAVADDHDAAVLAEAHADAAAVVEADPGGAAGDVQHRVEQRPVAHRVAAVLHGFGFAVGAGDAAAVEVVAADHDRRFEFAVADHFVEGETEFMA